MMSDPASDFDAILEAHTQNRPLPDDVDPDLRALAEFAGSVSAALQDVPPPPGGLLEGRQAFLAAGRTQARRSQPKRPLLGFGLRRVLGWSVAAVLLFFAITLGSTSSASDTLPGDALYPVKRVGERVRLLVSNSPNLQEEIDSRREREITALLRLGRRASVDFTGELVGLGPEGWVIAGRETNFSVLVTPETEIVGEPYVGARVRVDGETRQGKMIARLLVVQSRE